MDEGAEAHGGDLPARDRRGRPDFPAADTGVGRLEESSGVRRTADGAPRALKPAMARTPLKSHHER
ncbi:hypothetical protein GCM10010492_33870 [Saccharothrix mutabilis subsp. mutabilis]|uniref:Uncharacterized protein n=1 Tax=Saccharothrix mutabilis subsp. mutabilis TaxID=66855 RepID=A0ABP3DJD9_9PSEU